MLHPVDGGGGGGVGASTNIIQGVWGYCVPLDETETEFIFIGTINGTFEKTPPTTDGDGDDIGFRDPDGKFPASVGEGTNKLMRGEAQANDKTAPRIEVKIGKETMTEPESTAQNAVYPQNSVYEDASGNIFEVDGTDGNARIRLQHASGARIEINKDGDITIDTSGDIWVKGNMIMNGDIQLSGDITAQGTITANGDVISDGEGTKISLTKHKHIGNLGSPTTIPIPS